MGMRCAVHPGVETSLRCGKCGQPICPKCLVQTPVGARCRRCAQLRRLPTYEISLPQYLLSAAVGLALALFVGFIWGLVPFGGYLNFFIAFGVGYVIGELSSLSINRKRGLGLQIIAGISVFLCYLTARLAPAALALYNSAQNSGSLVIVVGELALREIIHILFDPFALITIGIGVVVAVLRLR